MTYAPHRWEKYRYAVLCGANTPSRLALEWSISKKLATAQLIAAARHGVITRRPDDSYEAHLCR